MLYAGGSGVVFENNVVEDIAGGVSLWNQGAHTAHNGVFRNNIFRRTDVYWSSQNGTVHCCVVPVSQGGCQGIGDEGLTCSQRMPQGFTDLGGGIFISSGDGTVAYNNVFEARGGGIGVDYGATNCGIYNNTLFATSSASPGGISLGNQSNAGYVGASNCAVRNNIVYQPNFTNPPPMSNLGSGNSFSTNLCSAGSAGGINCTVGDPQFASSAGGNFQLTAGSPAVNTGTDLRSVFTTDVTGADRPAGAWDKGAYELGSPPQPDPVNLLAWWKLDEGSGTTAADSSGNGHPGTLDSAAWGPGIIYPSAFTPTGTQEITIANTTGFDSPNSFSIVAWIKMSQTDADGCAIVSNKESYSLYIDNTGIPNGWLWNGSTYENVVASTSVMNGSAHMLTVTYDRGVPSAAMRLYIDGIAFGVTSTASAIAYNQGGSFRIGRDGLAFGIYQCFGAIQQVRLYSGQLSLTAIQNLYQEIVPPPGLSVVHSRFATADAAQGTFPVATDTDHAAVLGTPFGVRWAIHKSDTGSLTEYFRIFCRTFVSGSWGSWTEVAQTLGSLGVRYYVDSAVNLGDATSALLPLDGFPSVPGVVIADTVDLTSPYDAIQRITLAQGQHAEEEVRLVTGSPLIAGNQVQCRPYRENGTVFAGGYGAADSAVRTLTLQAISPPSSIRLGGTVLGGTMQ